MMIPGAIYSSQLIYKPAHLWVCGRKPEHPEETQSSGEHANSTQTAPKVITKVQVVLEVLPSATLSSPSDLFATSTFVQPWMSTHCSDTFSDK
ncbi:uncharacterized protein LOC144597286 isoform X2 [Rhinoraja longicauda]